MSHLCGRKCGLWRAKARPFLFLSSRSPEDFSRAYILVFNTFVTSSLN